MKTGWNRKRSMGRKWRRKKAEENGEIIATRKKQEEIAIGNEEEKKKIEDKIYEKDDKIKGNEKKLKTMTNDEEREIKKMYEPKFRIS
jgi:hypothetical protein